MKSLPILSLFFTLFSLLVQAQPTNGLIGYYSFCNCNANDNSGNGNHGALVGNPSCIPGQRGEGFLFNQTPGANGCGQAGGEYVRLPTLGAVWANGFTVCAWVRFDNEANYERIIDLGNASGDNGGLNVWFGREGASNNLTLESWISSDAAINRSVGRLVAPNAITNGSIEYYCATISGNTMRIYVNGVLKAEKQGHPILDVTRTMNFIGRSNWCAADPDFKGFMDEVRIYNRALDATEINSLFLQTPSFAAYQSPVSPGASVQLQAQGGVAYQWSPASSLNNPNIANPVATPTQTTTYTCMITLPDGCVFTDSLTIQVQFGPCVSTCSGRLGENIFPDGDFGVGTANILPVDPGIAPGYQYTTNPPPNDGFYCVTNNTSSWGSFASDWIDIQDNGPEANGYMMVVNASYQPGIFYQKTVDVCESTLYEFSIDIISMLESNLTNLIKPNLAFLINGNQVCETGNIPADEQWRTVRFSFTTSPGQNTVTLALRNSAPGGGGNDLAIDNISFRACGPEIILPPIIKFCNEKPLVELSPVLNNSPYPTIVYQWQIFSSGAWVNIPNANGQNLSIPNPLDGNQYRLLVANSNGNLQLPNCRVVSEPLKLQLSVDLAIAPVIQQITCNGSANGAINGAVSGGSAPYSYLWNNGATSAELNNLSMGLYSLSVTDNKGCTATSMAQILEPDPMTLDLAGMDITCQGLDDGALIATVGGGIAPYNFLWNSGQTQSDLIGLGAGNYQLTVTDAHDCTVTGEKTLIALLVPSANIGTDVVVELGDFIDLTAISSILPNEIADYTWSGPGDFLQCADCKNHRFQPTHTGCHTVIVRSIIGCEGLDTVCYEVIPLLRVYIPNSFSPNDDGLNDRFSVFSDQSVALVRNLSVFNRWGELVYQGLDLLPNSESAGWDGTFKGNTLRADVFTWMAELEFIDGERKLYSGDVTLVR